MSGNRVVRSGVRHGAEWTGSAPVRAAIVLALTVAAVTSCTGPRIESVRASDLAGAGEALALNIAAIQHRDTEAYLSQYLDSPDFVVLDADSLRRGYVFFAEARRASSEWPDTLVAGRPTLVWTAPGVVWAGFPYTSVSGTDTERGWSERLFVKTAGGWKIAITGAMTRR